MGRVAATPQVAGLEGRILAAGGVQQVSSKHLMCTMHGG